MIEAELAESRAATLTTTAATQAEARNRRNDASGVDLMSVCDRSQAGRVDRITHAEHNKLQTRSDVNVVQSITRTYAHTYPS